MSLNISLTKYLSMSKYRVLIILLSVLFYYLDNHVLERNPEITIAFLPVLAAIGGAVAIGSAIAGGVSQKKAAKRMGNEAAAIRDAGLRREQEAKLAKTPFAVSNEFKDMMQQQLANAKSESTSSSIESKARQLSDMDNAAAVSAMKRGAQSSAQYGANVLALKNQQAKENLAASVTGAQYKTQNQQMLNSLLGLQANIDRYAWEKNTEAPWVLEMQRAMQEQNAGREGKIASMQMKAAGNQSIWGGIGSLGGAAMNFGLGGVGGLMGGGGGASKVNFIDPSQPWLGGS